MSSIQIIDSVGIPTFKRASSRMGDILVGYMSPTVRQCSSPLSGSTNKVENQAKNTVSVSHP
jgi:hypothetical protein